MIHIPPEILIRSTIKKGVVLYFTEKSFLSEEPHYFIVLNNDPLNDGDIIMVNTTSNIEGRQKWVSNNGLPSETLVCVDEKECSFLKRQSIINCNDVTKHSIEALIQKVSDGCLKLKGEVNSEIHTKLKKGVISSPLVDELTKKMLAN